MTAARTVRADPDTVIAAARLWIGTPYLHQASTPGAGCDCLGLARGVWRALHGAEPVTPPPYSRDWGEAGKREVLADAAAQFLIGLPVSDAGPGALLLFRMAAGAPAKHCGILANTGSGPSLIHAYDNAGVIEQPFAPYWARRAAFAFHFPARQQTET